MSNKDIIRQNILNIRNNLKQVDVSNNSNIIIEKINQIIINNNYQNILVYMDMKNEVEASKLIGLLDVNYYVTKTIDHTTLKITKYNKNLLIKHHFGYYQINSSDYIDETIIDLVIVPGVAFDKNLQRIGFGKGYYDRLLPKCKNAYKIGVAYDFQIVDDIITNEFDVQLDMIITNKDIYI